MQENRVIGDGQHNSSPDFQKASQQENMLKLFHHIENIIW
jgi:hypothetical protein